MILLDTINASITIRLAFSFLFSPSVRGSTIDGLGRNRINEQRRFHSFIIDECSSLLWSMIKRWSSSAQFKDWHRVEIGKIDLQQSLAEFSLCQCSEPMRLNTIRAKLFLANPAPSHATLCTSYRIATTSMRKIWWRVHPIKEQYHLFQYTHDKTDIS